MSRRENVECGISIAMMSRFALVASPFSYSQTFPAFGAVHLLHQLQVWVEYASLPSSHQVLASSHWYRNMSRNEAEFKKNFAQRVQAVLPPEVPLEQVELWFQGEMRIGQRGTLTRIWARKGTRPRVVRQQQSESAYIFGAVCAQQDAAVGLVLPYAHTKTMALHLEAVSQAIPARRHAVLVLDQAGWHTTQKLPQCPNGSLLPLPAGSPELNPAEQVGQQLRDRSLANRYYDSYPDSVGACCEAWNQLTQIPGAIRSLCTRTRARLATDLGKV